jgi:hypothetical protein
MKGLIPVAMTLLFLTGFTLGDQMPILNPYELVRHSGVSFLPESGTRYLADQAKFGQWALAAGWGIWVVASAVASFLFIRIWNFIR